MGAEKPSWKRFSVVGKFSKKNVDKRLKKIEKTSLKHAHKFVISRLDRLSTVQRDVSVWVFLVVLLVCVSSAQWLFARTTYTSQTDAVGGAYTEGVLGPLETLNPIFAKTNAELSAARLLFASLYNYDTTGHIKADLAESLSINESETEYTVKLKDNLHWSDGNKISAADIIFTVKTLANAEVNAVTAGWEVVSAEQIDERTVKFKLPAAYAPFMHALTFPILPSHVLKDVNPAELASHSFSRNPVTSGPFTFRLLQNATLDGDKKIVHMVANENYHGGRPKLDRFQLYVYATTAEIEKGLKTREIIGTPELVYASQPQEIQASYVSRSYSVNNGVYALFNTQSQQLGSAAIRKALTLSVDVNAVRNLAGISTDPLHGPIPHSLFDKEVPALEYSVDSAKKMLDEQGWLVSGGVRKKDGTELKLSIVTLKGEAFEKIADYLATTWKNQLNVVTQVTVIDPNDISQDVLQTVLRPRNFDVLLYEFVIGGDPDVYAYWHSSQASGSGLNFSNYNNGVSDDALTSGRSKISPKQRADRYARFIQQWQKDVPALPIYQTKIDYVHLGSSTAIDSNARLVTATDRYANVLYWSVGKNSVYKTP